MEARPSDALSADPTDRPGDFLWAERPAEGVADGALLDGEEAAEETFNRTQVVVSSPVNASRVSIRHSGNSTAAHPTGPGGGQLEPRLG